MLNSDEKKFITSMKVLHKDTATIENLNMIKEKLNSEILDLENKVSEGKNVLSIIQSDIKIRKDYKVKLELDNESEIVSKNNEISELSNDISILLDTILKIKSNMNNLSEQEKIIKNEVDSLNSKSISLNVEILSLTNSINSKKIELSNINSELLKINTLLPTVTKQLEEVKTELVDLTKQRDSIKIEIDKDLILHDNYVKERISLVKVQDSLIQKEGLLRYKYEKAGLIYD